MLLTQPQTPRSKEKICSFVMQQCLAIWLNYETAKVLSVRLFIFVCLFLTGFFLLLLDLSETIEQILLHFRLCTVDPGSELIWARLNVFSSWIGKKPVELVLKILSLVICAMWLAHRGAKPNYKSEIWSPCAVMYKEISVQQGQWCVISWWMGICWIAPVDHSKYTEFQKKGKASCQSPGRGK